MDRELDYSVRSTHQTLMINTNYNLTLVSFVLRFRVFGDPPTQRTVEDIAFSVARYFSKNGSHVNYYMVLLNHVFYMRHVYID